MDFIATIHFHDEDRDAVAVVVGASNATEASNRAFEAFQEEGPSEVDVLTVQAFTEDFGAYVPGMFARI